MSSVRVRRLLSARDPRGVIAGEPRAGKLARGVSDRGSLEKDPLMAGTSPAALPVGGW